MIEVNILGRPFACVNEQRIVLPAKGYVLFALLASRRDFAAHVQEIRSVVWPQSSEESSGAALRQLSVRIRRQTEGIDLAPATGSIRSLSLPDLSLDVIRLLQLLKLVTNPVPGSRINEIADEILHLYRGDLLDGIELESGFEDELTEWISIERGRYKAHVLAAFRRLLAVDGLEISLAGAIVDRLIEDNPADEAAWKYRIVEALSGKARDNLETVYKSCLNACRAQGDAKPPPELEALRLKIASSAGQVRQAHGSLASTETPSPKRKAEQPLLLLTRALNGFGLEPIDLSLYERVAASLSKFRAHEIVELGTGKSSLRGSEKDAYSVHISPISASQLGFWLSWVDAQQRTQPSARLSGQLLWTGFVERGGGSCHPIEHQLTRIVRSIVSEIERAERDKFAGGEGATAYRLYLAAQPDVHRVDLAGLRRARSRFRDALKIDDSYAPALSGISRTYLMEWLIRGDPDSNYLHEAWRLARLAVSADREDGRSIHRLAHVELYKKHFDLSLELFDRAIHSNPSDPAIRADFADALSHAGRPHQALEVLTEISQTDPLVPENHHWIRGSTEFTLERFEDAVESFMNLADPSSAARPMAAALAMCGQANEAAKYVSVVRENYPSFRVSDWMRMVPNKEATDHERYSAGLVAAGL